MTDMLEQPMMEVAPARVLARKIPTAEFLGAAARARGVRVKMVVGESVTPSSSWS